jgi:hypothetical protein
MEPKHVAPNSRVEQLQNRVEGGRYETTPASFEVKGEKAHEKQESLSELGAAQAEVRQVAMPAFPAPVLAQSDDATSAPVTDDTPTTAGDDDLIEKEWVDKAKKILAETRDDPYRREQEVGKLQIEYIRKRYGREIGSVGDE